LPQTVPHHKLINNIRASQKIPIIGWQQGETFHIRLERIPRKLVDKAPNSLRLSTSSVKVHINESKVQPGFKGKIIGSAVTDKMLIREDRDR
jgi:hypothetical protein